MRAAIAELNLSNNKPSTQGYGHDILLDDDDLTGGSSSDDFWDVLSEEENEEYISDNIDEVEELQHNGHVDSLDRGIDWLDRRVTTLTSQRSGLDAAELRGQIVALLASDSSGRFGTYAKGHFS